MHFPIGAPRPTRGGPALSPGLPVRRNPCAWALCNPCVMHRTACVAVVLLAGCASSSTREPAPVASARGDVFYQSLDVATDDRYALREAEDFKLGGVSPDSRVVPVYPAAWLARAPKEVWLCTEVHVDEHGAVFGTRALHPAPCSPAEAAWDGDFRAAVEHAVRQWKFEPSYQCTLPSGAEADGECRDATQLTAVPVSRAFRFVFRVTRRGGVVEGGESPP